MLFILVTDVLNSLFKKARDEGLLQPLSHIAPNRSISLYANDVALFIQPTKEELQVIKIILDQFGEAAGLKTNLKKSCIIPMQLAVMKSPCRLFKAHWVAHYKNSLVLTSAFLSQIRNSESVTFCLGLKKLRTNFQVGKPPYLTLLVGRRWLALCYLHSDPFAGHFECS